MGANGETGSEGYVMRAQIRGGANTLYRGVWGARPQRVRAVSTILVPASRKIHDVRAASQVNNTPRRGRA
jgi:hypothetical protein